MESTEHDLIAKMAKDNFILQRLYNEHKNLEKKLLKFKTRKFLTAEEQMEQKRLKQSKLRGVDRMMQIISLRKAA